MSFVKLDRYYVNLADVGLVEDAGEVWIVRLHEITKHAPSTISVKKTSGEGMDLIRAVEAHL